MKINGNYGVLSGNNEGALREAQRLSEDGGGVPVVVCLPGGGFRGSPRVVFDLRTYEVNLVPKVTLLDAARNLPDLQMDSLANPPDVGWFTPPYATPW